MTPKVCVPVVLILCLSVSLPQVALLPVVLIHNITISLPLPSKLPPKVPHLILSPLDAEAVFLVLENILRTEEVVINAELAVAGVVSETALAVADTIIHSAANGITSGTNSTIDAVKRCSKTASNELQTVLAQFYQLVEKCSARDIDQMRIAYETVEQSAYNASEVLANAASGALACLTSGQKPAGISTCIGQALPETMAKVSEAIRKVDESFIHVVMLTSAFPIRTTDCVDAASAGTASAVAAVMDDVRACLATAPTLIH